SSHPHYRLRYGLNLAELFADTAGKICRLQWEAVNTSAISYGKFLRRTCRKPEKALSHVFQHMMRVTSTAAIGAGDEAADLEIGNETCWRDALKYAHDHICMKKEDLAQVYVRNHAGDLGWTPNTRQRILSTRTPKQHSELEPLQEMARLIALQGQRDYQIG
ncbi:unnamed protein product, partial [Amoebophrya sp. A25]